MRYFFNVTKLSFLIIGSVMGAGFLTGKEIVCFFSSVGAINGGIICAVGFFFLFYLILFASKKAKSAKEEILSNKLNAPFTFISLFICISCMASGLNYLMKTTFNIPPTLTGIVVFSLCFALQKRGIRGLERVNATLSIISVMLCLFAVIKNGSFGSEEMRFTFSVKPVLFLFINVYLTLPALTKSVESKTKSEVVSSLVVASVALGVMTAIIYFALLSDINNLSALEMPLFALLKGKLKTVFFVCLTCGILSSLNLTYFSIVEIAGEKDVNFKKIIIAIAVIIFSKINLSVIIEYVYPLIAGFGFWYLYKCLRFLISSGIKTKSVKNNNRKAFLGERKMKNKKNRNKPIKLSDKEYNDYIMSLKDEKPPKLIIENQK